MGELVLLVVAAAWAAVLIPPLLRSRIENRPNSSVTDFRRQLNRLQSTVPSAGGRIDALLDGATRWLPRRSSARRPAAVRHAGRTARRNSGRGPPARALRRVAAPSRARAGLARMAIRCGPARMPRSSRGPTARRTCRRSAHADVVRRRRSNMLFMLVLAAASTLFLAATTEETAMCTCSRWRSSPSAGYMYLLAQLRQREQYQWPDAWPRA